MRPCAHGARGAISDPVEIVVTSVLEKTATSRLHVLAVGVNEYSDSALRLSFAAPEARALSEGLKQAGDKLSERIEVTTVLDAEATAAKLARVFTELGKKVRTSFAARSNLSVIRQHAVPRAYGWVAAAVVCLGSGPCSPRCGWPVILILRINQIGVADIR